MKNSYYKLRSLSSGIRNNLNSEDIKKFDYSKIIATHSCVRALCNDKRNLTDEQIISQIKEGDEQALTFLLDKYKDLVSSKVGK